ncbi:hypothetical protein ACPXB3_12595 [Gordonia sp. DT219]|uniref:hypothetical protein n=1 Tax=Gordonia sp. DT219 TaxID=3416658 RepID=UPI003CE997E7
MIEVMRLIEVMGLIEVMCRRSRAVVLILAAIDASVECQNGQLHGYGSSFGDVASLTRICGVSIARG